MVGGEMGLQVCSLRRQPPSEPALRTSRAGDGALVLVKAGLLCLGAAILVASRLGPPLPQVIRNATCGVSMRCPRGWGGYERLPHGLVAFTHDGRFHAVATLWRLSWAEMASVRKEISPWAPDQVSQADLAHCLKDVAACLGFTVGAGRDFVEGAALGGRRALMLVAPRRSAEPWGALVVAAGEDLLFLELRASSQADLRAAWPQWKAMIRSVRVAGSLPL